MIGKVCRDCRADLPLDAFYANTKSGDRLSSYCKNCTKERSNRWYHANRERAMARAAAYRESNREAIRAWHRDSRDRNAKAIADRAWRLRNLDDVRERARARYRTRVDQYVMRARRWAAINPQKASEHTRRKNFRRRGVPMNADARAYVAILSCDPCSYCGGPSEVIDHIHPIAAGGDSDWSNLTAACRKCNATKAARPLLSHLVEVGR